jgi:uncharacterized membrane protein
MNAPLKLLTALGSTAVAFGLLDGAWLTLMSPRLYKPALGPLLADKINPGAALAFYAIYLCGLVYFAVWPALQSGRWQAALLNGAALGLVAYATYDLTNQATLRIWPARVTILDLAWGAFASALAATIGYAVTAWASRTIG